MPSSNHLVILSYLLYFSKFGRTIPTNGKNINMAALEIIYTYELIIISGRDNKNGHIVKDSSRGISAEKSTVTKIKAMMPKMINVTSLISISCRV